jgi:hypothetical protein
MFILKRVVTRVTFFRYETAQWNRQQEEVCNKKYTAKKTQYKTRSIPYHCNNLPKKGLWSPRDQSSSRLLGFLLSLARGRLFMKVAAILRRELIRSCGILLRLLAAGVD